MEFVVATVMRQCELWTDNTVMNSYISREGQKSHMYSMPEQKLYMVRENRADY